ncbi:DUF3429 domain-containing protein [Marinomonas posidonica]|uniref:DUF3429 domain-containing protein n=1 Tax=Marinomonas posidonica TaxID=936476 RepID=UPI0037353586
MMRTSASPYTFILGAMGLIPFLCATYLSWTNQTFFDRSGLYLFITYGAIILSFLSGTLWGQFVHRESSPLSIYLLISSNVVAVAAWFSLLLDIQVLSIALLFLGFISTFWGEARFARQNHSENSPYLTMRFVLTLIVCVLHLLVFYPSY